MEDRATAALGGRASPASVWYVVWLPRSLFLASVWCVFGGLVRGFGLVLVRGGIWEWPAAAIVPSGSVRM